MFAKCGPPVEASASASGGNSIYFKYSGVRGISAMQSASVPGERLWCSEWFCRVQTTFFGQLRESTVMTGTCLGNPIFHIR